MNFTKKAMIACFGFLALGAGSGNAQNYYHISTVAGNGSGTFAGDGGQATSASLSSPEGVAVDNSGNIYISDNANFRIRKVSTAGVISTVAGTGSYGHTGDHGPATAATISYPHGIIVDGTGNVYFSDVANARIRKISTSGIITTVAGNGTSVTAGDGGAATAASITYVEDLAIDATGNLYLADHDGNCIRKVTASTGIISTVAGTGSAGFSGDGGPATAAQLNHPAGIAVDASLNLYIGDGGNSVVRKVSPSGIISTIAGNPGSFSFSGDGGPASAATLNNPTSVRIDASGYLYIDDQSNIRIRKIDLSGTINTIAGDGSYGFSGDGGPAKSAAMNPSFMNLDAHNNVYFNNFVSNRISKLTPVAFTANIATIAGDGAHGFSGDGGRATSASFRYPYSVAYDSHGNMYIADSDNGRIRKVTTAGVVSTYAGNGTADHTGDGGQATAASLFSPAFLAIDASDNLYVGGDMSIRKITPAGIITNFAGTWSSTSDGAAYGGDGGPATAARFASPSYMTFDHSGNLYISDNWNKLIRKINTSNIVTTVAGNASEAGSSAGYSGDGGAATATILDNPAGLAVDASGNLYFCDGNCIRKVNTSGTISTVAGVRGATSVSGDGGMATDADFWYPHGLAIDATGNLYVGDYYGACIRKIDQYGYVIRVAGTGGAGLSGDGGPATAATFFAPTQLLFDPAGNLIVCDDQDNVIRRICNNSAVGIVGAAGPVCSSTSGTLALSVNTYGGTWASSNTSVATVSAATIISGASHITVTPFAAGTTIISYSFPNTCGSSGYALRSVSVIGTLDPGTLTGASTFVVGHYLTLAPSVAGGTWSSDATSVASPAGADRYYGVSPGTTTIHYNVTNSCGTSTVSKVVSVTAHRDDNNGNNAVTAAETPGINIYPNPTSGLLNIDFQGIDGTKTVQVIDMNGRVINTMTSEDNAMIVDMSNLKTGMYLLNINGGGKTYNEKIIMK